MAAAAVADCIGLRPEDVLVAAHRPVLATVGNPFVLAELHPEALSRAVPDIARFRRVAADFTAAGPARLPLYLYARDGAGLRARMFSPLSGTTEDAATGSAATPLAALLLSLSGAASASLDIWQGVELGRPSLLRTKAWRAADGIRASVGGGCVPVLEGHALV
jgi:trans-2,3-dihydro-3-hydroxyanthranilate isomerase